MSTSSSWSSRGDQFKLCLLTYKTLHGLAPPYIADLCRLVTTVGSRQRLRSSTHGDLVVSSSVTHFGTRAFAVVGPKAWNQLPMHIRARETVSSFKLALKTHFHFGELNKSKLSRHPTPHCITLRRIKNCWHY